MIATGTEKRVCEDIAKRQELGVSKYKNTVEDNPLPLREWLQHAYEETLDQAIYLKRSIEEIDNIKKKHEDGMRRKASHELLKNQILDSKRNVKNSCSEYQMQGMDSGLNYANAIQALEFEMPYHSLACVKTDGDGNWDFLMNEKMERVVTYDSCQCKNKEHRKLLPFGSEKGFNA